MVSVLRLLMGVVLICKLVLREVWCGRREWIGWLARSEAEVESAFSLASPYVVRSLCGDGRKSNMTSYKTHGTWVVADYKNVGVRIDLEWSPRPSIAHCVKNGEV